MKVNKLAKLLIKRISDNPDLLKELKAFVDYDSVHLINALKSQISKADKRSQISKADKRSQISKADKIYDENEIYEELRVTHPMFRERVDKNPHLPLVFQKSSIGISKITKKQKIDFKTLNSAMSDNLDGIHRTLLLGRNPHTELLSECPEDMVKFPPLNKIWFKIANVEDNKIPKGNSTSGDYSGSTSVKIYNKYVLIEYRDNNELDRPIAINMAIKAHNENQPISIKVKEDMNEDKVFYLFLNPIQIKRIK